MLSAASNTFLLVYAALFPIVNPLGGAPFFLGLTRHYSVAVRHALAARIAVNGFLVLMGSLFVGSHILDFFGISLPIVRVAGGCVVSAMAWQLLQEGVAEAEEKEVATSDGPAEPLQKAFYPLTMPLTVGPGSIATAITLGSQRPLPTSAPEHLVVLGFAATVAIIAIAATIYLAYRFADTLELILGKSGTNVFIRLSAFILLCIGFQIVWSGVSSLIGITQP